MNVNVVNAETGTVTYVDTSKPGWEEKLRAAGIDPKPPAGPVEADPDEVDPEDDGEDIEDGEDDEVEYNENKVEFDEDEVA
jgi:hypothetical protein